MATSDDGRPVYDTMSPVAGFLMLAAREALDNDVAESNFIAAARYAFRAEKKKAK